MALDYWSVGDPDSRIRRSLESQFSEAMGDIQLGFSYQDAGTVLYINIFYHMMSRLGVINKPLVVYRFSGNVIK